MTNYLFLKVYVRLVLVLRLSDAETVLVME